MAHEEIYLGAYASLRPDARTDPGLNGEHLRAALRRTGCIGLEVPWASATFVPHEGALVALLEADGHHVLTMVAATMEARSDSRFGLASLDTDGRRAAIELVRRAHTAAVAMSDRAGRAVVDAVQVQSAATIDPGISGTRNAHVSALASSLDEIASWDWRGGRVLLEHCDSATGVRPVKGFLPLEDEIQALALRDDPDGPAITINWGRSVLETRRTETAVEHVRLAAASGMLGARAYSGVAGERTPLGEAWGDSHLAARGPVATRAGLGASLLSEVEIRAFAAAATGGLTIVKVNASSAPGAPDPLDVVAETCALVRSALRPAA